MCTVSMIGDHYSDKWKKPDYTNIFNNFPSISRPEFDALKKEVEEMKKLLERALAYDKANNEPHCEMEDKVKLLKQVAKMVGVDLDTVFKDKT